MKANGGYRDSWMPACSTMMPVVLMCGPAESRRHGGGGEKTSPIGFSHGPRKAAIVPNVTGRSNSENRSKNGVPLASSSDVMFRVATPPVVV